MKENQIRKLVNELRDIAIEYHGTQQLCERIARTVRDAWHHELEKPNQPVSQTYELPQTQFEQVADLYEMQFDDGRTCAFHTDGTKAAQWLLACDGNKVQEYVRIERYQEAVIGNSPVQSPIDHGYRPECECSGCKATARICAELNNEEAEIFADGYNAAMQSFGNSEQLNSPVTPDGWVMVPKVVTAEIGNAINEVGQRCTCGNCSQRLWDLLLAAAPKPQNAPQNIPENIPAGKSTLTPDGWISCSERMPDSKTGVLVAREFGRKGDWRMKWGTYIPGHPDAKDGWIIPGASWLPTHWMPLPAPPQH
ncbi:DUF551 domain-containing protein [Salmonella enterica]|uniref:DUF551 domain-containing protein n=1 Tax=Salmonella enterica TaxID=28901 RepID=UPI0020CB6996|nr:DUF551 domain-containing protein [Salmonella enterica]